MDIVEQYIFSSFVHFICGEFYDLLKDRRFPSEIKRQVKLTFH